MRLTEMGKKTNFVSDILDASSIMQEETLRTNFAFTGIEVKGKTKSVDTVQAENTKTRFTVIKQNHKFLVIALLTFSILSVVLVVTRLVFPIYTVTGNSMQPNYTNGNYLVTDQIFYKLFSPIQRGDVIILREPVGSGEILIKRVIGLPGDKLQISNDTVYINNQPLNEPYTKEKPSYTVKSLIVPANEYYVLGDNRNQSFDSSAFGFVPANDIIARVLFKLF